jgi:predicted AlkP superfamily phosphohydrolase/phosphomutase
VIAVDVPMTFCATEGPGIEISGWGTHQGLSPFAAHPPSLAKELSHQFGLNSLGPEIPVNERSGPDARASRERVRRDLIASAHRKGALTRWLATTRDWDLLISIFGETHRGGHVLWPSDDSVPAEWLLDVYRAVDEALGATIADLQRQQTTIVLFSLHGMGSNDSQRHFLHELVSRVNRSWMESLDNSSSPRRALVRDNRPSLVRALRTSLPSSAKATIARCIPRSAKDYMTNRLYAASHDWSRTPALVVKSDGNGYIRLNISGRERHGLLDSTEAAVERYVSVLSEALRSFRTQFDEPLIDEIKLAREIFVGGKTNYLPDVIVTWKKQPGLVYRIDSPIYGEINGAPDEWRGGYHREGGFLCLFDSVAGAQTSYPRTMNIMEVPAMIRGFLAPRGVNYESCVAQ